MPYTRTIKVYQPDGVTLDTDWYDAGVVEWRATKGGACADARFFLGAYGGCLDGAMIIAGDARDGRRIKSDSVIKMFYDSADGTPVYTGVAEPFVKWIEKQGHEYQLRGLWRELEKVDINARLVKSATTIGQIVQELYDDHISGLSLITASSITANTTAVSEFILEEDANIYRLLEQLAMMASADGDYWVAGVDQAGVFYFQPISTTVGNVQATFEIGTDATKGEEQDARFNGSNRIKVRGNWTAAKFETMQNFTDSTSITANGRTRWRDVYARALRDNADLVLFKNGYFNLYADPQQFFDRVARVHTDGDTVPVPWSGRGIVADTQRGVLQTDFIKTLEVEFNERLNVSADIGRVSRTSASKIEPNAFTDYFQDIVNDSISEILPVTDNDNAPYSGAPGHVADGANNPGFTGGGGLDPGAIQVVHSPPMILKNTDMTFQVMINLAGQATGTGAVTIHYDVLDDDRVASTKSGTQAGVKIYNDGNYDVYEATITGMPNQAGWVQFRVESAKIGASGSYFFPKDGSLYDTARVVDEDAEGGTVTTQFLIPAGWLYNGQ